MSESNNMPPSNSLWRLPPFTIGSWAALAYVEGKYNPPSARDLKPAPNDFLGIYVSGEDPGVSLITTTGAGEYMAFHRCGTPDATAEFAMIDAFLKYQIPFEQWRAYPIGPRESEALAQLGLQEIYDRAMKGLAAVLYQARLNARPGRKQLPPMFLLFPQSHQAIHDDQATQWAVTRSLLGEERAARYLQNKEKLKHRFLNPQPDEPTSDTPKYDA